MHKGAGSHQGHRTKGYLGVRDILMYFHILQHMPIYSTACQHIPRNEGTGANQGTQRLTYSHTSMWTHVQVHWDILVDTDTVAYMYTCISIYVQGYLEIIGDRLTYIQTCRKEMKHHTKGQRYTHIHKDMNVHTSTKGLEPSREHTVTNMYTHMHTHTHT